MTYPRDVVFNPADLQIMRNSQGQVCIMLEELAALLGVTRRKLVSACENQQQRTKTRKGVYAVPITVHIAPVYSDDVMDAVVKYWDKPFEEWRKWTETVLSSKA